MGILGLINDYAAVVHSFVNGRAARSGTILILSIGAEAVSTAVVKVTGALIETVAALSAPGLGGHYVLDNLASYLLEKSESVKSFSELSAEAAAEWREHARELLLNHAENNESISVAGVEQPYVIHVPKAELLDILAFSLKYPIRSVDEVLKESGISRDQLDFVLIVGGIVSSPVVAKFVAQSMPGLRRMILNVDRAAAFGAALRAGVLVNDIQEPLLWDVLTQSIYKTQAASNHTIVRAGTSLPASVRVSLSTPDANIMQHRATGDDHDFSSIHLKGISPEHDSEHPLIVELAINGDGIIGVCEYVEPEKSEV